MVSSRSWLAAVTALTFSVGAVACGRGLTSHPGRAAVHVNGASDGGATDSGVVDYHDRPECFGDPCFHATDCSTVACNEVTGHCFTAGAECPGFPCNWGTDCPSVSCNTATHLCN